MKIAIAGPGRSGTSLLVELFGAFGFSVPSMDGNWSAEAQAGLESRIGESSPYEVDKDPWAYEYLDRLGSGVTTYCDHLIVPLRARLDVAVSRSVQERLHRATHLDSDEWAWNTWGSVRGGAVVRTDVPAIAEALAFGLWDLLEKSSRAGLSPKILHFPRFAEDFNYFWDQLGSIVATRQSHESAEEIWSRVCTPGGCLILCVSG